MPTYEYECRECRGRVEAFQKMSDEPLTTCADCGGSLRRLMFPVGIVFKGSGFYVTDYKNKGNGSASLPESSSDHPKPKSESGETSKTDTKPASTTASTDSS